VTAKAATSRPKQSKKTTTDEMELDGVEMVSLEGMWRLLILSCRIEFVKSTLGSNLMRLSRKKM
jgi:hypothetical protein